MDKRFHQKPIEHYDPRKDWRTIFYKDSGGYSSKRVLGILGFVLCCAIFVLAFFMEKDIPDFAEMLLVTSASLCGVDSITSIWSKSVSKTTNLTEE